MNIKFPKYFSVLINVIFLLIICGNPVVADNNDNRLPSERLEPVITSGNYNEGNIMALTGPITNREIKSNADLVPQPSVAPIFKDVNYDNILSPWEQYKNALLPIIKKNWDDAFKGQNYVVIIGVKVSNVGKLLSCNLIKSSDSRTVDKSAIKAILKTYPFFSTDIQYEVKYDIKFDYKSGEVIVNDPVDY